LRRGLPEGLCIVLHPTRLRADVGAECGLAPGDDLAVQGHEQGAHVEHADGRLEIIDWAEHLARARPAAVALPLPVAG
jgi:hypothetical protein